MNIKFMNIYDITKIFGCAKIKRTKSRPILSILYCRFNAVDPT